METSKWVTLSSLQIDYNLTNSWDKAIIALIFGLFSICAEFSVLSLLRRCEPLCWLTFHWIESQLCSHILWERMTFVLNWFVNSFAVQCWQSWQCLHSTDSSDSVTERKTSSHRLIRCDPSPQTGNNQMPNVWHKWSHTWIIPLITTIPLNTWLIRKNFYRKLWKLSAISTYIAALFRSRSFEIQAITIQIYTINILHGHFGKNNS